MQLGMYTAEIHREAIDELFRAIRAYGYSAVQLDLTSVCGEQLPRELPDERVAQVRAAAASHAVDIAAVNGTFNMIHPDPAMRRDGIERFRSVARIGAALACPLLTICTGTRSTTSMWTWHEDNASEEAWRDLLESMEPLVAIAEKSHLVLGVECEASNVVSTPDRARRLLDELRTPVVKIIMDGANLFPAGTAFPERVRPTLDHAFDLLRDDIVLAHGKDLLAGPTVRFTSAGRGIIDFEYFLLLLEDAGYRGPMILHGMKREEELPAAAEFMKPLLDSADAVD